MDKKPKKLLCQRCRLKKIKCNYEYPCNNCEKGKYECIQVTNDMRKKRPTVNYVENLEKKYSQLMNILKNANSYNDNKHMADYLLSINLQNLVVEGLGNATGSNISNNNTVDGNRSSNGPGSGSNTSSGGGGANAGANGANGGDYTDMNDDNDFSVYGPISIYDNHDSRKQHNHHNHNNQTDDYKYIKQLNENPEVLHCIKLFFVWQYPDLNMFIFREAFLKEFFKPKYNNLYCSRILILSICALGARMSDDDKIYNNSFNYYNQAKNLLLDRLNNPSITSLQSFLLLSFYDIFNGYNSSGWMLSGNAIRMGFDLGFQLHPDSWFLKLKYLNYSKENDNEVKSRIYWGTYLADHFISLLLGRPSLLKLNDATIPETDDLPELQWIDDYRYLDANDFKKLEKISNISSPLKSVINLINISDNMLNDIFNKNFNQDFLNNSNKNQLISTVEKLNEYNDKIVNWKRNLPPDLQFNKNFLKLNADNPTLGSIRYYYYILVLCLNRPFIGLENTVFLNLNLPFDLIPRSICLDCIEDLYIAINRFILIHGYRKMSIFIVYCSILSISVILLLKGSNLINNELEKLKFFLIVLKNCSKTWKLAEKSLTSITSHLEDFNIDLNSLNNNPNDNPNNSISLANTPKIKKSDTPEIDLDLTNHLISTAESMLKSNSNSISNLMNPLAQTPTSSSIGGTNSYNSIPGDSPSTTTPINNNNNNTAGVSDGAGAGATAGVNFDDSSVQSIPADTNSMTDSIPMATDIGDVGTNGIVVGENNLDFFGGPPVLMTSDLFNQDWESLFPDYIFNEKNN